MSDPPEMEDPPRRWPDDSPEEDFEARRATDEARLGRWMAEQKHRPLTDMLGEPSGQGYAGVLILPDWWDQVPEPGQVCPWCQRPGVPAPCPECRQARATAADAPSMWAWWPSLTAQDRRLHIAARYGTDPWSGRRVAIYREWADVDPQGQVSSGQSRYPGCPPDGIYWKSATER
jgi:hypothetical protein